MQAVFLNTTRAYFLLVALSRTPWYRNSRAKLQLYFRHKQQSTVYIVALAAFIQMPSCHPGHKLNESASSTFRSNDIRIQIKYGKGEAEGFLCTDTVTIRSIKIADQPFVVVKSEHDMAEMNAN